MTWLTAASVWATTKSSGSSAVPSKKPAYWRDERLAAVLTFPEKRSFIPVHERALTPVSTRAAGTPKKPERPIPLVSTSALKTSDFVQAVKSKTQVQLVFAGEWSQQLLAISVAGGQVRELMDEIAQACNAHWYPGNQNTWVLASNLHEVSLVLLSADERYRREDTTVRQLAQSLTPDQWARLINGSGLAIEELTPAQRGRLMDFVQLDFYAQDEFLHPSTDALKGIGLLLQYSGSGKDALLVLREGQAGAGKWEATVRLWNPATGNWTFGFPAPR